MSAGLPGLGLGGLFFIFSALLAPFPELWRTLRGRSDLASWKEIGRQLAQALAMVAAIDLTLRLTYVALSAAGIGDPPSADEATVLPLNLIGITTGLLIVVLCGAKLAELAVRARGRGIPRVPDVLPRVAPLRAGALGAVVVMTWIALLATGASRLSPLERPQREQIASRPEPDVDAAPHQAAVEPRPQPQAGPSSTETEVGGGGSGGAAGTRSGAAAPGSDDGAAGIAPSPTPATSKARPATPAGSPPAATPEPAGSHGPPPNAAAGGGGPPESAGQPEGAPGSEGPGPAAEPPPQAPAKGLREAG